VAPPWTVRCLFLVHSARSDASWCLTSVERRVATGSPPSVHRDRVGARGSASERIAESLAHRLRSRSEVAKPLASARDGEYGAVGRELFDIWDQKTGLARTASLQGRIFGRGKAGVRNTHYYVSLFFARVSVTPPLLAHTIHSQSSASQGRPAVRPPTYRLRPQRRRPKALDLASAYASPSPMLRPVPARASSAASTPRSLPSPAARGHQPLGGGRGGKKGRLAPLGVCVGGHARRQRGRYGA
jgi:hypothetical protein